MPITYAQIEAAKRQQQQNNSGNWIANMAATLRASAERKAREQELPEVVITRPAKNNKTTLLIIAAVALIAFYLYRNYNK